MIKSKLHEIRNFIVLLMGHSVDYIKETSLGYDIAQIEVRTLNLKDYCETEINFIGRDLKYLLLFSAILLEMSIFELSMDLNITCTLGHTIIILEMANSTVNCLYLKSKIGYETANYLSTEIANIILEIETIIYNF
ncbi:MAG: hypothetical protein ACQERB_10135 [Promethearchaeati archaeon]